MARTLYRLCCAGLLGAQLFFALVAVQAVFPAEVAGLPRDHPRRQLAADLVGTMVARLDAGTIAFSAVAAICAIAAGRRRAAIAPLLAGLCASASALLVTPAIHSMRAAGEVASSRFGALHGISTGLLLLEMILLAVAAWRAPA